MSEESGVWRTIGGRRVFIKDGEDLATAMKRSGKFKNKEDINRSINKMPDEDYQKMLQKEGIGLPDFSPNDNAMIEELKERKQYEDYYEKEHLGKPKYFVRGNKVKIEDVYSGQYNSGYVVIREATKQEKIGKVNESLKSYIVTHELYGGELLVPDIRMKRE